MKVFVQVTSDACYMCVVTCSGVDLGFAERKWCMGLNTVVNL